MCAFRPGGRVLKFLKITRFGFCLLMLTTFTVHANGFAQKARVTLHMEQSSLVEIIRAIRKVSDYQFLYRVDELEKYGKRDLKLENAPLEEVMENLLQGTSLNWRVEDGVILIKSVEQTGVRAPEERRITGQVKDEKGNPLPGVTVVIKGSRLGTVTDHDGKFSLGIPEMEDMQLLYSFVGMEPVEVKITARNEYKIVMQEAVKALEDVVVTGYFNKDRDSFTGAEITVKGDELKKVTSRNILQALTIFDPSIRFEDNIDIGSDPNRLADFTIRGNSGIGLTDFQKDAVSRDNLRNNPNLPTFIMDGYEVTMEKIFDLDINRIESVTILKDASATAIYGSRAANGVIVVKTKVPEAGKLTVSYSFNADVAIPDLTSYDLLDAREKLNFEKSVGLYDSPYPDAQADREKDYNYKLGLIESGVNTYWLAQPLKVEFNQKHSIFIEGGDKAIRYGVDVKYDNNNGVMKGSLRNRGSLGFSLSYNWNDKLLIRNYLSVDKMKRKESPYGDFAQYALLNPYYPFQDEHGELIREMKQMINSSRQIWNPVYEATVGNRDEASYLHVTDNLNLEWNIIQGLRFRTNFSYGENKDESERFTSPESLLYAADEREGQESLLDRGEGYFYTANSYFWDLSSVLTYHFGTGKHFVNIALGVNMTENVSRSVSFDVKGFPSKAMDYISLAKEFVGTAPGGTEGKSRLMGMFANLNYSYGNRYLLDLSYRMDGSSQYGSDKKYSPFWAVGVGWNIHKEKFMENLPFSRLKIRGSVGSTGKASFAPYQSQTMFEYIQKNWYATGIGAQLMALGNPNLKWETTMSYDLGLDIAFLEDRISLTVGYYLKKTKNLLSDVTLPTSVGFSDYKENLGEMENEGIELALRAFVYRDRNWNVSVFANMSNNKNRIVKISNALSSYNKKADQEQGDVDSKYYSKPMVRFREGESSSAIYAMRSLGIDPATGKELYRKADGTNTFVWDPAENVVCGDASPKVNGALGTNLTYKRWSLNASFTYKLGGQVYNQTLVDRVENADIRDNVDRRVLEQRWQKPGDRTFFKDIANTDRTPASSRFIQDENVLQLSSLSLSWDLKREWVQRIRMQTVRLGATMNDLFRLSTVKRERGLDYPFARNLSFSIMVQF